MEDSNAAAIDNSGTDELSQGRQYLTSRAYQIEMFEESMRENTIVAMETGSGKTQIAKLRIEAELERSPQKRIWFCAPSVVLAQQQDAFLSAQLPACQVRLITGLDNVQFWSTQEIWDAVLNGIHLVVSTPQVLLDALSHGFVVMQHMSLLIFDEAHHCVANDPMAQIMLRFYHPQARHGNLRTQPHILGLTASPITNKALMLEQLERNMHAVCKTPTLQADDYKKHVYLPKLERISFVPTLVPPTKLLKALESVVAGLSLSKDPTVSWLQQSKSRNASMQQKLDKILASGRTPVMKQLSSFFGHAQHICDNIGPWAADLYIKSCASKIHEATILHESLIPTLADYEQEYIDLQLKAVLQRADSSNEVALVSEHIAPKARAVIDFLLREYKPGITAIIFVKRRSIAFALANLLDAYPQMNKYKTFSFVGMANPAYRGLVDLTDMFAQNEAFADFQSGRRNICIATQVMEEGVDVQATNLVIRFDEPENFRSFVQSRGRARQPNSKFIMVHPVEAVDIEKKLYRWKELEAAMKYQYADSSREIFNREAAEQEDEEGNELYRVAATGAVLTYDNARQHLEHFCATLPWEGDFEPARAILIISGALDGPKSARVVLPSSIPLTLRVTNSLRAWRTERMAKRDAAFQTYKRLHMAKLINDNLLPFPRAKKSETGFETRDSVCDVSEVLNPWTMLRASVQNNPKMYQHRIKVTGYHTECPDMFVLLPVRLDCDLSFDLHSNLGHAFRVTVQPEGIANEVSIDLGHEITRYLFMVVLGRRLKAFDKANDLPYLIMPDVTPDGVQNWLERCHSTSPLSDITFSNTSEQQTYLLKHGREEILYRWHPQFDGRNARRYSADEFIMAERLSKQLNFVRYEQANEEGTVLATSDTRCLLVEHCQVQGLPAGYGNFMLLMPSISYMLEVAIRGQLAIQQGPLKSMGFSDSELVRKALTSSHASSEGNFESLEFVGDSLLKYYASIQVFFTYPELTEGGLTVKYAKIVNNARLQRATKELGLDAYITVKPFSGHNWTLTMKSNDPNAQRQMSSKTLADVIEALIGAAYLDRCNGPSKDVLPISALIHIFPDVPWKSPTLHLQAFYRQSNPSKINIARLEDIEHMLHYTFEHKPLLVEALTRTSLRIGKQSFQRLEFLGDAILDRIVNVALYNSGFGLDPEHLKYRRDALVNRWTLAFLSMNTHHTVITNTIETTVRGQTTINPTAKVVRLVDHMRTSNDRAEIQQRQKAETTFLAAYDEITNSLTNGRGFPWTALHSIDTSKSYSDIIESILGAVFIDSGGSLSQCEKVLESLGLMAILRRLTTNSELDARQPIVKLGLLYPDVKSEEKDSGKLKDGSRKWKCTMSLGEEVIASAESAVSQKHAEACSAQLALDARGSGRAADEMCVD